VSQKQVSSLVLCFPSNDWLLDQRNHLFQRVTKLLRQNSLITGILTGKYLTHLHPGKLYEACNVLAARQFWKVWSSFRRTEFTGIAAFCIHIQRNKYSHGIWNSVVMTLQVLWIDTRSRNACKLQQGLIVEVSLALPSDYLVPSEVTLNQTVCLILKYKERRLSVRSSLTREFRRSFCKK
jgi:hypothetical protein